MACHASALFEFPLTRVLIGDSLAFRHGQTPAVMVLIVIMPTLFVVTDTGHAVAARPAPSFVILSYRKFGITVAGCFEGR